MALSVPGLVMMVIFYLIVLSIGTGASMKSKKMEENTPGSRIEVSFLPNQRVNLVVGVFTMTGAFIIGVAESVYDPTKGLIWALVPLQVSISFVIGGLLFAKPMREKIYISMMDPFERKYGKALTVALAIVSVTVEIIWVPGLLISLGVTMSVILDLPFSSVWISAAVVIAYTVLGGLHSVACTDVVQLPLALISLWLCVPFVLAADFYIDITKTAVNHTYRVA